MQRPIILLLVVVGGSSFLPAQQPPRRHVTGTLLLAAGQSLDLDSGVILTREQQAGMRADLVFSRGTKGFIIHSPGGALEVEPGNQCARASDLEKRAWPLTLATVVTRTQVFFLRTDKQHFARVELGLVAPYGAGVAQVRYAVNTWGSGWFPLPPNRLDAHWNGQALHVDWRGPRGRWRISATCGGDVRSRVTEDLETTFTDLKPRELYRIEVLRELPDGEVSLPASGTWLAGHAAVRRGVIQLPDRWYGQTGGLDLRTGSRTGEDPDVLLYLYGVGAPGGGVRKLGRGTEVYRDASELPEHGYLPVYGRLDEDDVLAVRLADGRFAKLRLEPLRGRDLRKGMRVHYAVLPAGGRTFMAPPEGGRFRQLAPDGVELSWTSVAGATRYRVTREGPGQPTLETTETLVRIPGLESDRMYRFLVTAEDALGNTSDPLRIRAHTYPPETLMGRLRLDCSGRNGAILSSGSTARIENPGQLPAGVELRISSSADGASSLRWDAPFGIRAAGKLPFGNLDPHPGHSRWSKELATDDREPGSDVFLVRTGSGGLASVRIVKRTYPEVTVEFIVSPPPLHASVLKTWMLASGVVKNAADLLAARKLIATLSDPDRATLEGAFTGLRTMGRRAAPAIYEALERLPELPLRRQLERLARALMK